MNSPLLLDIWYLFFGESQYSLVNGYSETSCDSGVFTGEDERMSFLFYGWTSA